MFNKIQKLLIKNNISMTKLGKAVGISQGNMSDWKSGKSKPKFQSLQKIADFFHVPLSYFYEDELKGINIQCNTNNGELNGIKNVINSGSSGEQDEIIDEVGILLKGLSDEDKRQVLNYAKFISEQKK